MKPLSRRTIMLCLVLILALGRPSLSFAVEDAIIAVVNDELITLKDLKDYVRSTYVSLIAEGMDNTELQTVMKDMEINGTNKLIEDKLILSKANKIGLEVREDLVNERVEKMKQKYGSEQKLVNALVKNGATLRDLRNKIKDQMKIQYIIDHEVKSKIYVNPQEVTGFYEKHKNQFSRKDRINLDSIFIPYGNGRETARTKAEEVLGRIGNGEDFDDLMEKYSKAPPIGTVERGQLLPSVEETVFNLRLYETSPVVETDNGIYIFKLLGKSPANISSLEEVKDTIYSQLFQEKFKDRFMNWLTKLKKDAYIEIKQ